MRIVYTFLMCIYDWAIQLISPFHAKAQLWVNGRKNATMPDFSGKPIFWFHCASLGEFDMAIPLMQRIRLNQPNSYILVSFFSPSGMEHYQKRGEIVDGAVYLPIDRPKKVEQFLNQFNPKVLILVKYEFWPNLIIEAKKRSIFVVSICTSLRENQRFFKWYGGLFRRALRSIDFFYTQNSKTAHLLSNLKIDHVLTMGDTRYDRVLERKEMHQSNARIETFLNGEKAIILGSTWAADERLLIPFIHSQPNKKFILAPHDIGESRLIEIESQLEGVVQRYTAPNDENRRVLLLNTIGHLTDAYQYAALAYVGGGFSGKLHNILEPIAYAIPVIFGPKHLRYTEAEEAIREGIAFSIHTAKELNALYIQLDKQYDTIREQSIHFVNQQKGASDRILNHMIARLTF
jgi:3-deoxy-D-manno-octulosonic-acid transferase